MSFPELLKTLEEQGSGDPYECCKLGDIHRSRGDYNSAKQWYEQGLKVAKKIRDKVVERIACDKLGHVNKDVGDFETSIHYHKRDLEISKELGDRKGEGRAHCNLGNAHKFLAGNFEEAIYHSRNYLEISKELGYRAAEGRANCNLGNTYVRFGNCKEAIYHHECDLKIAEDIGDKTGERRAHCNLGNAHLRFGNFEKAIYHSRNYLEVSRTLGDRDSEGLAHGILGDAYFSKGDVKTARDFHEHSLRIAQEIGNKRGEGAAYLSLGNDYGELGSFKEAMRYHQRHLTIAKELGDKESEGCAYCNIGICYDRLGEIKTGIECHESSLKIAKEVGNKEAEGNTYLEIGMSHYSLGHFQEAIKYVNQSLEIFEELGNKAGEAKAKQNIGIVYDELNKWEEAIQNLEDALNTFIQLGDRSGESTTHVNLASIYSRLGNFKKALPHYDQGLQIAQELKLRNEEGTSHLNIGSAYMGHGNLRKAIEHLKLSVQISKEVGNKNIEAKANCSLGRCHEALASFPDALCFYQRSIEIVNGLRDGLQSKDEWKISLRHMYEVMYSQLWGVLLAQGKIDEALIAADQGRAQALNDLLKSNYGFEDFCLDSRPEEETTFDTLHCLPSNTIVLALHKKEIFHWVIQEGKVVKFNRQDVCDNPEEDAITFHQSLIKTARDKIGVRSFGRCEDRSFRDGPEDEELENERGNERECQSSDIQTSDLRKLHDVIIGPIADVIDGDELIIVPEGPLCLAFYAAFIDTNQKYLIESYRIRVLPSLNSWRLIASCPEDYHCKTGALLVGDPCLEKIPKRARKSLKQLPCAREEVKIIGRMLRTAPLIGEEATKDEVTKRLSEVSLIHIAAHGRMETGEILLAPNPTASPKPREKDYILTMADVLEAKLRARLVVLSCCHSARGEIKAEGVVGIARAFLGAGARSVLVSLWALQDDATMEFMKRFYKYLTEGQSASGALNRTMNFMRESDEFNEVKHWAPFVLIGDDVTLEFGALD